jgi:hypothetical protein
MQFISDLRNRNDIRLAVESDALSFSTGNSSKPPGRKIRPRTNLEVVARFLWLKCDSDDERIGTERVVEAVRKATAVPTEINRATEWKWGRYGPSDRRTALPRPGLSPRSRDSRPRCRGRAGALGAALVPLPAPRAPDSGPVRGLATACRRLAFAGRGQGQGQGQG